MQSWKAEFREIDRVCCCPTRQLCRVLFKISLHTHACIAVQFCVAHRMNVHVVAGPGHGRVHLPQYYAWHLPVLKRITANAQCFRTTAQLVPVGRLPHHRCSDSSKYPSTAAQLLLDAHLSRKFTWPFPLSFQGVASCSHVPTLRLAGAQKYSKAIVLPLGRTRRQRCSTWLAGQAMLCLRLADKTHSMSSPAAWLPEQQQQQLRIMLT